LASEFSLRIQLLDNLMRDARSTLTLLRTESISESWCSQILSTRHPSRFNRVVVFASRVRFRATFASQ
jgi:hypothetical protein